MDTKLWDMAIEVYFVLHTQNPLAQTCREPDDFCIVVMVVVFYLFGLNFYEADVMFVNTCSIFVVFSA